MQEASLYNNRALRLGRLECSGNSPASERIMDSKANHLSEYLLIDLLYIHNFLSQTCMKAGLLADCWFDENTKIYRFSAEIFTEIKPRGNVKRKKIKD